MVSHFFLSFDPLFVELMPVVIWWTALRQLGCGVETGWSVLHLLSSLFNVGDRVASLEVLVWVKSIVKAVNPSISCKGGGHVWLRDQAVFWVHGLVFVCLLLGKCLSVEPVVNLGVDDALSSCRGQSVAHSLLHHDVVRVVADKRLILELIHACLPNDLIALWLERRLLATALVSVPGLLDGCHGVTRCCSKAWTCVGQVVAETLVPLSVLVWLWIHDWGNTSKVGIMLQGYRLNRPTGRSGLFDTHMAGLVIDSDMLAERWHRVWLMIHLIVAHVHVVVDRHLWIYQLVGLNGLELLWFKMVGKVLAVSGSCLGDTPSQWAHFVQLFVILHLVGAMFSTYVRLVKWSVLRGRLCKLRVIDWILLWVWQIILNSLTLFCINSVLGLSSLLILFHLVDVESDLLRQQIFKVRSDSMLPRELSGQHERVVSVLNRYRFVLAGSDLDSDGQNFTCFFSLEGLALSIQASEPRFELSSLVRLFLRVLQKTWIVKIIIIRLLGNHLLHRLR